MTADSPASGLPQEAVEAANDELHHVISPWVGQLRLVWHKTAGAPPLPAPDEDVMAEFDARIERATRAALAAALPFLREQWEAERESYWKDRWVAAQGLHDVIAAERAKVAALQQAVDKVRALCERFIENDTPGGSILRGVFGDAGRYVLSLLPAVSEGATTVGAARDPLAADASAAECWRGHEFHAAPQGLPRAGYRLPHRDVDGRWVWGAWEDCPSQSDKGEQ